MTATTSTIRVRSFRIIGTDAVVFQAWEPTAFDQRTGYRHSTITSDDQGDGTLGKVTTRRLEPDFDAAYPLDWSDRATIAARREACAARSALLHAESYAAIIGALPDLEDVEVYSHGGEITANYRDVAHLVDERGKVTR